MASANKSRTQRHIHLARLAFGVIVLLAVLLVATHLAEGRRLGELLLRVRPLPLCQALALQSATYLCVAVILNRALGRDGERRAVMQLLPLALAKQFVSQAVPSVGVSGSLMLIRGLERRQIPRAMAVRAVLVTLLSYYLAFAVTLAATMILLWRLQDMSPIVLTALTLLLVLLASGSAAMFWMGNRAAKVLPKRLRGWLIAHELDELFAQEETSNWDARLLVETAALHFIIFLLDAATLHVMLGAVGAHVAPTVVFASLVTATAVASIGLVPGGLGTFEGTCVTLLHAHGVDLESALAGTILLRAFTFWLPMLPGLVLTRREMRGD